MSDTNAPTLDPSEDIFAGMKKKKKSKKVNFDEEAEATPTPAPVAAPAVSAAPVVASPVTPTEKVVSAPAPIAEAPVEEGDLDFSDLKKKKKKKAVRIALSDDEEEDSSAVKMVRKVDNMGNESFAPAEPEAAIEGEGGEFADLKKKKKKGSKKAAFDEFEKELEAQAEAGESSSAVATPLGSDGEDDVADEEGIEDGLFGNEAEEGTLSKAEAAAQAKAWLGTDRDYTYTELLGRFYSLLYASHPSLSAAGTKKKYTIPPPQIHREGNKRSIFVNIVDICKRMHRSPDHVIQFLFAELGTSGSVDGSGRLVIKGRFQQKQIENVLRRYIVEYVTCKTCKSPDSTLTKDNRLFFMTCGTCGSTRSVSAIKSGFQAQTGKRRAMRVA